MRLICGNQSILKAFGYEKIENVQGIRSWTWEAVIERKVKVYMALFAARSKGTRVIRLKSLPLPSQFVQSSCEQGFQPCSGNSSDPIVERCIIIMRLEKHNGRDCDGCMRALIVIRSDVIPEALVAIRVHVLTRRQPERTGLAPIQRAPATRAEGPL